MSFFINGQGEDMGVVIGIVVSRKDDSSTDVVPAPDTTRTVGRNGNTTTTVTGRTVELYTTGRYVT